MEPNLAADILATVNEAEMVYSPMKPTGWRADYYVVTPKGTRTRFQRNGSLMTIRNAMSETALLYHLKTLHPGADVIIQSLEFR